MNNLLIFSSTRALIASVTLCAVTAYVPRSAAEGHAHVHGVAKVSIAADAQSIIVLFDSPLDNLLGFEHSPQTPGERSAVALLMSSLNSPGALIKIEPAANCVLKHVDLQSAALGLGNARADSDGHGDMDATFEFTCTDASKATYINLNFFDRFPRMQRIDVEGSVQSGQFKREMRRPDRRIEIS